MATRARLLAAARPLFAQHGYGAVGTEAVVRAAGVTRGALYHQFRDKQDLFRAVFEEVQTELVRSIAAREQASQPADAIAGLRAGVHAWLDACADPEVERIILVDAPSVLGFEEWRASGERHGLGLVIASLEAAMDAGAIPRVPVHPLAQVLVGALDAAALHVARSDDPESARRDAAEVLDLLVGGLAVG